VSRQTGQPRVANHTSSRPEATKVSVNTSIGYLPSITPDLARNDRQVRQGHKSRTRRPGRPALDPVVNAQHGVTVIVVTHAEDVARFAARRVRLRDGHVLSNRDVPPVSLLGAQPATAVPAAEDEEL
jgi:hypothetical protein